MAARRGTFGFDLSKPSRKGMLLKQGHYHKAFKHRFFVLYPGFLVYYDDEQRWKYDITRGETLASRIGAVKLKGGSVQIARDAPKGCKFGLIINAPDPANKRPLYLLNALSKPDRNAWIEAVRNSIPQSRSPQAVRKDVQKRAPKEPELVPQHPKFTTRQDTADVAALEASGPTGRERNVEETSVDQLLPPSMAVRHDTADAAALLSASISPPNIERVTSIDEELGPMQGNDDSSRETTPAANSVERSVTPPPIPTELETNETVENSVNAKGKVEVVTSVTVVANGVEDEEVVEKDSEEPIADLEEEEEPHRKTSEVTFTREEPSNSFSVIVANVESGDSSLTSDDEGQSALVEPKDEENTCETGFQDQTELESPSATPTITVAAVESRQEEATAQDQSGNSSPNGNGSKASLTPPESPSEARRSFTEKRGFLYKRGGHRKSWNLRYFILQPGGFTYYKKDPAQKDTEGLGLIIIGKLPFQRTKPLGEVKLKDMNIFFPAVGEKQQSYQFHVHTQSSWNKRPTWVLAAQSEREMKAWIQAFKLAGMLSGTSPANSDSEGEPNGAIPTHS